MADAKAATITRFRVAVYESTGAEPLDASVRGELVSALLSKGYLIFNSCVLDAFSDASQKILRNASKFLTQRLLQRSRQPNLF